MIVIITIITIIIIMIIIIIIIIIHSNGIRVEEVWIGCHEEE